MEKKGWNFKDFLQTPLGMIVVFMVVFYAVTFGVYYFYSPGPEERRMAREEKVKSATSQNFDVTQESLPK